MFWSSPFPSSKSLKSLTKHEIEGEKTSTRKMSLIVTANATSFFYNSLPSPKTNWNGNVFFPSPSIATLTTREIPKFSVKATCCSTYVGRTTLTKFHFYVFIFFSSQLFSISSEQMAEQESFWGFLRFTKKRLIQNKAIHDQIVLEHYLEISLSTCRGMEGRELLQKGKTWWLN